MPLVITRKLGEKIRIGDDIEVVVARTGYRTGVVRLSIKAPRHIKVLREELVAKEVTK